MDLALYGRVLRRFWYIALAGGLLAIQLSFFSYYKVDSGKITPRAGETWEAEETLMVTERGFPVGRGSSTIVVPDGTTGSTPVTPVVLSPTDALRYSSLAPVYATLADSDAVLSLARRLGLPPGTSFRGSPVSTPRQQLPFVRIIGSAATAEAAVRSASAGSAAFQEYVRRRQAAAGISKSQGVQLQVVNEAKGPIMVEGPSLTIPIGVLLTVLAVTIALIFILENVTTRRSKDGYPSRDRGTVPSAAPVPDPSLRTQRVEVVEAEAPPGETSVAARSR